MYILSSKLRFKSNRSKIVDLLLVYCCVRFRRAYLHVTRQKLKQLLIYFFFICHLYPIIILIVAYDRNDCERKRNLANLQKTKMSSIATTSDSTTTEPSSSTIDSQSGTTSADNNECETMSCPVCKSTIPIRSRAGKKDEK